MEVRSLEYGLNATASQGVTLNLYEKASLDVALLKLKKKEQLTGELFFWGKLCGQEADYYLCYIIVDEGKVYPIKKFYFSTASFDFRELPKVSEDQAKQLDSAGKIIITGVPSRVLDISNQEDTGAADEETNEDGESSEDPLKLMQVNLQHHVPSEASKSRDALRESHALSHLISRIDYSTAAVPRGAFRLKLGNKIASAPEFNGLSFLEAQSLSSWVHFRPADNLETLRALASKDYQFHADFLETLENDIPKGSWTFRYDPSSCIVTLRSILWPGYIAYCVLNTKFFGSVYIGNGEQNVDLPFLLP